jgi:hypothetical protein
MEGNACRPVSSWLPSLERDLQRFMESHLKTLLGVTFLASEWTIHAASEMRIDTLGIDADGFPVVIEYKKDGSDSILNQAIFYVSHLQQRKGDFTELVRARLGETASQSIDWKGIRAICLAHEFATYDLSAVEQLRTNVDLVTFEFFTNSTFELDTVKSHRMYRKPKASVQPTGSSRLTFSQMLVFAAPDVQNIARSLLEALDRLNDSLLCTDSREGLMLSTTNTEIGSVRLSGGLYPKIRVVMHSHPDELRAIAFPNLKISQDTSTFTLRTIDQLSQLLEWINDEVGRSLRCY